MARALPVVAAVVLALAVAAAAAALARRGGDAPALPEPPLPAQEACFGDLPEPPPALRELDRARSASLHRELAQNVSLDEDTVMSVIALSQATGVKVPLEEVANRTTHRFEVCSFELAVSEGNASYSIRRVVAFRVTTTHSASLDRDTAMRAIALNASGVPVDPRDVITLTHDEHTQREFYQFVDSDDVLRLVLAKIREDAAVAAATPPTPRADTPRDPPVVPTPQRATSPPPAAEPARWWPLGL